MSNNRKTVVKGILISVFGGLAGFAAIAFGTNTVSADSVFSGGRELGIALMIGGVICIIGVIIGLITVYFTD